MLTGFGSDGVTSGVAGSGSGSGAGAGASGVAGAGVAVLVAGVASVVVVAAGGVVSGIAGWSAVVAGAGCDSGVGVDGGALLVGVVVLGAGVSAPLASEAVSGISGLVGGALLRASGAAAVWSLLGVVAAGALPEAVSVASLSSFASSAGAGAKLTDGDFAVFSVFDRSGRIRNLSPRVSWPIKSGCSIPAISSKPISTSRSMPRNCMQVRMTGVRTLSLLALVLMSR